MITYWNGCVASPSRDPLLRPIEALVNPTAGRFGARLFAQLR